MSDCKFCSVLAAPDLGAALPNLLLATDTVVAALNRRPIAPGHVTLILKAHRPQTSVYTDADLAGLGTLVGRLSSVLEHRYAPKRVILLGDGKPSAHLHLHLIPELPGAPVSPAEAVADLNQATRTPTLSDEAMADLVRAIRAAMAPDLPR